MTSRRGLFIVLEGIDGAGTTTQTEHLVAHLRQQRGRRAVATREPSTGPVGRLLRELLAGQHHTPAGEATNGRTMALLFAADRLDHLHREIEPQLAAGVDVISDRYLLSSLAYQAEEADQDWVAGLARGVLVPDVTLLLDVTIEQAAARRQGAGRTIERYDADRYLARVVENYRRLARSGPHPVQILDGGRGVEDVIQAIVAAVGPHLEAG